MDISNVKVYGGSGDLLLWVWVVRYTGVIMRTICDR